MDARQAKNEVIASGRELSEKGLVARTWGNVSCRIDESSFAITPSGIGYDRLTPDFIVQVDINDGSYEGDVRPSSEKGIHAGVYKLMPEVQFIIHTHQTYATCASLASSDYLKPTSEELELLGGGINTVSYAMPGTSSLKNKVLAAVSKDKGVFLLERHGALIMGRDKDEAFSRAALLEDVCKRGMPFLGEDYSGAIHISKENGIADIKALSPEKAKDIEDLARNIFANKSDVSNIFILATPAIDSAMNSRRVAPAILDDFAQIVGIDAKIVDNSRVIASLKDRSAVFVPGIGAVCCAGSESDCEAVMRLAEKNILALAYAEQYGQVKPISFLERKIMHYIYTKKYSKMK